MKKYQKDDDYGDEENDQVIELNDPKISKKIPLSKEDKFDATIKLLVKITASKIQQNQLERRKNRAIKRLRDRDNVSDDSSGSDTEATIAYKQRQKQKHAKLHLDSI